MVKYIFLGSPFNTSWIYITKKLFDLSIAEPVIFIGHDRHYQESKKVFGKNVIEDFKVRHRPYEINNIEYNGENIGFFESKNYLRAKDICLKLMDRLDNYGNFSRVDREVYFHKLCILYLKKIEISKPQVLIAAESPHDHCRYILFEISRYLKLPCYKFNNWTMAPLLMFQNMENGEFYKSNVSPDSYESSSKIKKMIEKYLNVITNEDYEVDYMRDQRKNKGDAKLGRIGTSTNLIKDFKHNIGMFIRKKYNPINPYNLGLLTRAYIIDKRKKNLRKSLKMNESFPDLNMNYVYFPLHFEPERTSNPDGGDYHDQFKVLSIIRNIIPDSYKIYVKEHPSQIFYAEKGAKGRSSLFYDLLNGLKSVELVKRDFNSQELIRNSKCVFTLTGTVAIESAILGKPCVVFGPATYYSGCPNTINYTSNFNFEQINNLKIKSKKEIYFFFMELMKKYSIPGIMNASQKKYFKQFDNEDFIKMSNEFLYNFLKDFFLSKSYVK